MEQHTNNLNQSQGRECVIILHGLGRTSRSMQVIQKSLEHAGYNTFNCNYPSRDHIIEWLADEYLATAVKHCKETFQPKKIHFVTHSMGGILTRYYLSKYKLECLGRVVMLAPPNQGSEWVDRFSSLWLFKQVNGPAGQQLGTGTESLPNSLGPVDYEVGIIIGNQSFDPLGSVLIPGENDGKVSVESAKVAGMTDFFVVPYGHTFVMNQKTVIKQTLNFLKTGSFNPNNHQTDNLTMPELNQAAPEFTSLNQDGETVSLSQYRGVKNVVLYFYPRDDTPGCTTEAIEFTALIEDFHNADTIVLGVSRDTVVKHQKFIKKRELKVDLIADESGEVCEAYGVWQLKKFMGREFMGIMRSTFVIDKKGMLVEQVLKVKAKGHAQQMLDFVKTLK